MITLYNAARCPYVARVRIVLAEKGIEYETVEIDLADFERRAVLLPPTNGSFADLAAVSGKLLYRRLPLAGASEEKSTLMYYDLEKREEKTILNDVDQSILASKGENLLVRRKDDYAIIEPKEDQKFDKKLPLSGLQATIDPAAEWKDRKSVV